MDDDDEGAWKKYHAQLIESSEAPIRNNLPFTNTAAKVMFQRHLPTIYLQACTLLKQKQKIQAYMLFMRYISFVMNVKKHKDYGTVPAELRAEAQANSVNSIRRLEGLKIEIKDEFVANRKKYRENIRIQAEEKQRKEEEEQLRVLRHKEGEEDRLQEQHQRTEDARIRLAAIASVPLDDIIVAQPVGDGGGVGGGGWDGMLKDADAPMLPEGEAVDMIPLLTEEEDTPMIRRPRLSSFDITNPVGPSQPILLPPPQPPQPVIPPKPHVPFNAISTPLPPDLDRSFSDTSDFRFDQGPLRSVLIPGAMIDQFIRIAQPNTSADKETCGLLMGKMTDRGWVASHLFIPPQTGSANNCDTYDEMKVFNAQIAFEVVTIGWIHTHPSQTNFLSSIDLHTQYLHQLMLPEAVAIVVAPTDVKKVAVYTIPVPEAMAYLSKCPISGFHEHRTDINLFRDASHATLVPGNSVPFEILDLR